jgi:hypothetical protein
MRGAAASAAGDKHRDGQAKPPRQTAHIAHDNTSGRPAVKTGALHASTAKAAETAAVSLDVADGADASCGFFEKVKQSLNRIVGWDVE